LRPKKPRNNPYNLAKGIVMKRQVTHAKAVYDLAEKTIMPTPEEGGEQSVLVEVGTGSTTISLARLAHRYGAKVYSIDISKTKIRRYQNMDSIMNNVEFKLGNSHEMLNQIAHHEPFINFAFLDGPPSALHTFEEFMIIQDYMLPCSILLIDNACLPCKTDTLSSCRKGKIVVPYLLASPCWKVDEYLTWGDSMIAACKQYPDPDLSHPDYEYKDYEPDA
jgi:hypothetical protein